MSASDINTIILSVPIGLILLGVAAKIWLTVWQDYKNN